MLSISVIKTSGATANYFAADNYYAKDGQEALERSGWGGRGAEMLGLSGGVDKDQFKALLEGVLPDGQQLGRVHGDGTVVHRPGWDLTFSAPKSVSLLALVGGDQRLEEAHREAVEKALSYLEANAIRTRSGSMEGGGVKIEQADTMIVAMFHHDSSRELDPQLHTHSVVMNATLRADGQWRAIESREIYRAKMLAGAIYRAELADRIVAMGYQVERSHADGRFEIKGLSNEVLRHFSQRRVDIERSMEERGLTDAKGAERAALMTRAKKHDVDRSALREEWGERASSQGADLRALIEKADPRFVWKADATLAAQQAVEFAAAKLAEREAVFSHDELIQTAVGHAIGDVTFRGVEEAVKNAERGGLLVPAAGFEERDGGARWTTSQALRLEGEAIMMMKASRNALVPVMASRDIAEALAERPLTDGQRKAAELILSTSDRVVGVQGYAGTGKTYMLDTVRELAELRGYEVRGFAPTAVAANELKEHAHMESTTLARHVIDLKGALAGGADGKVPDYSRQIWVVDEASMIATRQMHEILSAANRTGARVVLVGDVKQLGAVEAGKPFVLLQNADMATGTMDEIMRQKNPELLGAVKDSIQGLARAALEKVGDSVYQVEDRGVRLKAVADHYLSLASGQRDQTLVLAPANEDRVKINDMIREGLKKEGVLGGPSASGTALLREGLTKVELGHATSYKSGNIVRFTRDYRHPDLRVQKGEYAEVLNVRGGVVTLKTDDGRELHWQPSKIAGRAGEVAVYSPSLRELQRGDVIRWTLNDKDLGRRNSELARVERVEGQTATVRMSGGGEQVINLGDRRDAHWEHAYASTVHAAQGKTIDNVIVHAEDWRRNLTNQKSFYVELSRARHGAYIYTNDREKLIKAIEERTGDKSSALEGVKALDEKQLERTKRDGAADPSEKQRNDADKNPLRKILDGDGLMKAVSQERLKEGAKQRDDGMRRVMESEHQL